MVRTSTTPVVELTSLTFDFGDDKAPSVVLLATR